MPSGTAQREAIARATQAARQQQLAWREAQARAVQDLLGKIAGAIQQELMRLQDGGGDVRPEQIPALRDFVTGQSNDLFDAYRQIVMRALPESARIGAQMLAHTGSGISTDAMVTQVMAWLTSFRAADGLQLSDRLWRIPRNAATELDLRLQNLIVRGQSSYQAALEYINQGKPVPTALADAMAQRRSMALAVQAKRLLADPHGDVLYAAQRVLRTESNRAYTESYVSSVAQHPDVIGMKFMLSPNHPRTDICDLYARANLHGLGPGVYPPGNTPYPAHPNTLSLLQPVFKDEVTDAHRAGQQTAFDWLRRQPAADQDSILGKSKAIAFRAGMLQDDELRAPWHQVAARLGVQP